MKLTSVIGLLWGDEGKGKIIDLLAGDADYVVRYSGGHNAGHTIYRGETKIVLHLLPSGVFRDGVVNVIGNGVVVDPWHLDREVVAVRANGARLELGRDLLVSERAPLVLPVHQALDRVAETVRGAGRIGTTGRGIGPAYGDRASRGGLRMGDLIRPDHLRARLSQLIAEKAPQLRAFDLPAIDESRLRDELVALGATLAPAILDTGGTLRDAWRAGRRILTEGAQGVLLDVDHGTYPFVTSSSSSTGGIAVGTGLPPAAIGEVFGVVKAYATRVGEGPFPTELQNATGERLRIAGREYGSTTGRPRRCGWFDAVAVRHACEVSGTTAMVVTNLDVLSGFNPLHLAVAYNGADGRIERFPAYGLDEVSPIYEQLPGFDADLGGVRNFDDLPAAARAYVERLEQVIGVPALMISVGPGREQVIRR